MRSTSLHRKRDLAAVMSRGYKRVGTNVSVQILDRRDDGPCRTAVVVTRRMGSAVVRNRIRRRLREALRHANCVGNDAVIFARRGALTESFQNLVNELSHQLRRAS